MSEFLTIYAKKLEFSEFVSEGTVPIETILSNFSIFYLFSFIYIYKNGIVNGKKTKIVW